MKAKDLVAKIPAMLEEIKTKAKVELADGSATLGGQLLFEVLTLLLHEAAQESVTRKIQNTTSMVSLYDQAADKWTAFLKLVDHNIFGKDKDSLHLNALPIMLITLMHDRPAKDQGDMLHVLIAWYRFSRHKNIRECLGRQLAKEIEMLRSGQFAIDPQTGQLRKISNV